MTGSPRNQDESARAASAAGAAPRFIEKLGLNRSTIALLAAILLIGMGQELWSPFMPKFIQVNVQGFFTRRLGGWGLSEQAAIILIVGLFGVWKDLQEAVNYYLGGRIGGTLGTRRALIGFALLPLVGYALLLAAFTPLLATIMAFASLPFISAYDSISQPAALTVVGDTLKAHHRTMAFSLQAIQRRISRIAAYLVGGALVALLGAVAGVRAGVALSVLLVLLAVFVQVWMLHTDTKDQAKRSAGFSKGLIRRFHPELRKLLVVDICARWAEGMPRELFILYAVASLTTPLPGLGQLGIDPFTFGWLLALMSLTSLVTYLPIGYMASRPGGAKKPFINLTFVFFALFPLAFYVLGPLGQYHLHLGLLGREHNLLVPVGLMVAYVIAGLREIGEPARKAMITELLPQDAKTAATGLYWSVRSFSVMLAPIVGAILWVTVSPAATFIMAFALGAIGAVVFALIFNRNVQPQAAG